MAVSVAVSGSETDSRLLLFHSVFACLYIGCRIIKNVCRATSESGFLTIHQETWQRLRRRADRMMGDLSGLSRSARWRVQTRTGLENIWMAARLQLSQIAQTLFGIAPLWKTQTQAYFLLYTPLCPPGISVTFRWLSSNINDLTFTGRRVIYGGRSWTFATPPECIPVVSLMSATESVIQRNILP